GPEPRARSALLAVGTACCERGPQRLLGGRRLLTGDRELVVDTADARFQARQRRRQSGRVLIAHGAAQGCDPLRVDSDLDTGWIPGEWCHPRLQGGGDR